MAGYPPYGNSGHISTLNYRGTLHDHRLRASLDSGAGHHLADRGASQGVMRERIFDDIVSMAKGVTARFDNGALARRVLSHASV